MTKDEEKRLRYLIPLPQSLTVRLIVLQVPSPLKTGRQGAKHRPHNPRGNGQ